MKSNQELADAIKRILPVSSITIENETLLVFVEFVALTRLEDIRKLTDKAMLIFPHGSLLKIRLQ